MFRAQFLTLILLSLGVFLSVPSQIAAHQSNSNNQKSAISNLQSSVSSLQSPVSSPPYPVSSRDALYRTSPPISALRTGWSYDTYPEASYEKMFDDLARMKENGATAIWIGHNNPGEVDTAKLEPGMSYAVYAALQHENDPLHEDARAMAGAIKRALDAARAAGLQVILPIGYQIQMGSTWNGKHPNELRRKADGEPLELYTSGHTASPFSAQYRRDIARYYEWVQKEWVSPYQDVIVMLSLADEPMGGDYSQAAQAEFLQRYEIEIDSLPRAERWRLGEFQAGVIADYATWSAQQWQRINPNILTTMSFHGGETARRVWGLPEYERLFSETPDNFVITFDAYLHDDLPVKAATADEAAQLKLFLTTIGNYSRLYDKPIALWGGVNAWGLAQESDSPLDLPDAVTNLLLLYDLPARLGANLWGIFAWNYNVKAQGLENYARSTTYDSRAVEIAVNRTLPLLHNRLIEKAAPDIALITAPRAMYNALALSRAAAIPPDWFDTTPFARAFSDRNIVLASSPRALESVRDAPFMIVPARAQDLDAATIKFLREHVARGTVLLATDPNLAKLLDAPSREWRAGLAELPHDGGVIYLFEIGE